MAASLVMHYDTWSLDDRERWCWENLGRIITCPVDAYSQSVNGNVCKAVGGILAEFSLPIRCQDANPGTQNRIAELVNRSARDSVLGCQEFLRNLNVAREKDIELQPALVIEFDGRRLRLNDGDLSKGEKPPVWGWTWDDGLILLRCVSGQPLSNVVRHEMGHLLGVSQHHGGCVMDWACERYSFCSKCVETIQQTCKVTR